MLHKEVHYNLLPSFKSGRLARMFQFSSPVVGIETSPSTLCHLDGKIPAQHPPRGLSGSCSIKNASAQ